MKKVLTIAGSDSSGGAGIQADLKTFQELGVYGMSSLTVIVSMDPFNNWAHNVFPVAIDTIKAQIETVIDGIGIDAMKTGMLPTAEIIELTASVIKKHGIKNAVIDPVMVCKGAGEPLNPESTVSYIKYLAPLAKVITPNIFEACQLSGMKTIDSIDDMKNAAAKIRDLGAEFVVIKGGKAIGTDKASDLVFDGKNYEFIESEKINTTNTHGAGCTFSAAVAASIANGMETMDAIRYAKKFVTCAIKNSFALNQYVGPLSHYSFRKN